MQDLWLETDDFTEYLTAQEQSLMQLLETGSIKMDELPIPTQRKLSLVKDLEQQSKSLAGYFMSEH